jgi:hypothetical protein
MKVLHYISTIDTTAGITSKYMSALCSMSGCHAEIHIVCASSPQPISINNTTVHFIPKGNRNNVRLRSIWLKTLYDIMPDIIHVHGCWSYDLACVVCLSTKHGFRTVLSPQGGLEPWIFKQRLWKEKIPKTVFYQWGAVRKAFAIHVSGAIEYKNFKSLRWNKRIAIVKNSLITSEIDDEKMASEMLNLYRKILDTDVFRLMDKTTHEVFSKILHAGISGKRSDMILEIDEKGWRQLMIFSKTENIYNIFLKGCSVQQIDLPDIDVNKIETFVTRKNGIDKYEMNASLTNEQNIVELVKKVRKETFRQEIKLATLCQLSLILRNTEYDEDLLRGALKAKGLIKFMGRIEQIQNELMGLEEGFMPVESVNDISTSRIKKIITRNLTI